jgi:hypothetical protein
MASFTNWLGLHDTKVGSWMMAIAGALFAFCQSGDLMAGCETATGAIVHLCTACKVLIAVFAGGYVVKVNGERNAMKKLE